MYSLKQKDEWWGKGIRHTKKGISVMTGTQLIEVTCWFAVLSIFVINVIQHPEFLSPQ